MNLLEQRNNFSNKKIQELKKHISELNDIERFKDSLCIYVTGSFARGEASEYSDIDIFFVSSEYETKNLDEIVLKSELIKLTRRLKLPDFSGDGEFLKIHSVEEIIDKLGSPDDDYNNYFTARMLLLLESKVLFNETLYRKVILKIINVYFNDYKDHEESFKPVFLANDIIRFWKTMCLNYEEKKKKRNSEETAKNKSRLKNLKLKFSRITTCYSILCCLRKGEQTTPEFVYELIQKTPIERLIYVRTNNDSCKSIVDKMLILYEWFLENTTDEAQKLYDWIGGKEDRSDAFTKADEFHDLFYQLIEQTSKDLLKYYTL